MGKAALLGLGGYALGGGFTGGFGSNKLGAFLKGGFGNFMKGNKGTIGGGLSNLFRTKDALGNYKGFNTGKLHHYAAFNKSCKKFKIALPPTNLKSINESKPYIFTGTSSLTKSLDKLYISSFYKEKVPYKSRDFFVKRYENHPYYQYKFHEVTSENFFKGFIVSRVIKYNGSHALRIIEVVAEDNLIGEIIDEFATTISSSSFEYVDVYVSSINNQSFAMKNFEDISSSNDIIVPDHFEPYEKKNIDIHFMTSNNQGTILFKGDGDQDRPSIKS